MKRYIFHIIALTLGLAAAVSCSEAGLDDMGNIPHIELNLVAPGAEMTIDTKATKPGVTDMNENLIESVDYFIWPDAGVNGEPYLSGSFTDVDASNGIKTYNIGLNNTDVNTIFPGSIRTCTIFVIVNRPNGVSLPASKTLANLRALETTANFLGSPKQSSFVMTYDGQISLNSKLYTTVATANINLKRLASRLTCDVTVAESYTDPLTGVVWTPVPSSMNIKFYNAVNKANFNGDTDFPGAEDRFSYTEVIPANDIRAGFTYSDGKYQSKPFYTYPFEWTRGSSIEPYLMIILPWSDGTTQTRFYYKVILDGDSIERNLWHHINLNISILGSMDENRPTLTMPECYYYVEDWKTSLVSQSGSGSGDDEEEHNVEAIISDARYLVVQKNEYVINNLDDLKIPFGSSHDCRLGAVYDNVLYNSSFTDGDTTKVIYAKYENLSDMNAVTYDKKDASGWLTVNNSTHFIEFHHELQNDTSHKPYDYTPYIITFRLQHKGDDYYHKYFEEITIIQYPAMYVSAEHSGGTTTSYCGHMWLNGGQNNVVQRDSESDSKLGGSSGITDNAGNKNKNMYVITTTVLPENSAYYLADPRETEINNLTWGTPACYSGKSVQGGANRTLKYYYPAKTSAGGENYLAPKFRIASSYGVCAVVSYGAAQRRCASYQEEGRPMGRWRLPTIAEVEYMCKLTTDEYIPRLLGSLTENKTTDYWAGNGYVTVYGTLNGHPNATPPVPHPNETGGSAKNVRCVYDEWYWANSQYPLVDVDTPTWGDVAR